MTVESIKKVIAETADSTNDTVDALLDNTKNKAHKLINKAKSKSSKPLDEAKETTENLYTALQDYVNENPIKSLGIAALVGLVAGYIAKR